MSDRNRTLPPPARRDRDVGGFAVKPGEAPDSNEVVDLRGETNAPDESAMPSNGVPAEPTSDSENQGAEAGRTRSKPARSRRPKEPKSPEPGREKELRQRLIASLTPPTKERLDERARTKQASFADVLIEAWLNHGDALEQENQPDEQLERRQKLGVRRPRHKRPPGRSDVQFYLTERELKVIEESATAAGYENRSAYIEELLIRELRIVAGVAETAKQ